MADNNENQGSIKKQLSGSGASKGKKKLVIKKKVDQTGVVYLSRVPPYMKPDKLRMLLKRYGEVNRVYLTPEDPAIRKRRIAKGGNKRQNYIDGWTVEMAEGKMREWAVQRQTAPTSGQGSGASSTDGW